jgi:hypothetical protein
LQRASRREKIKAICWPDRPTVTAFKLDVERYRAMGYLSDGQPGPVLDLRPLFERYQLERGG